MIKVSVRNQPFYDLFVVQPIPFVRADLPAFACGKAMADGPAEADFPKAGLPAVACLLAKAGGEGRNRTKIAAFFKTHYSPTTALPPEAYRLITNEHQ